MKINFHPIFSLAHINICFLTHKGRKKNGRYLHYDSYWSLFMGWNFCNLVSNLYKSSLPDAVQAFFILFFFNSLILFVNKMQDTIFYVIF